MCFLFQKRLRKQFQIKRLDGSGKKQIKKHQTLLGTFWHNWKHFNVDYMLDDSTLSTLNF